MAFNKHRALENNQSHFLSRAMYYTASQAALMLLAWILLNHPFTPTMPNSILNEALYYSVFKKIIYKQVSIMQLYM